MGVKQQPTSTGVGGLEEDKKAVYKNDDEYDEDLAQLDMLLHYVNNLSASLEFLAWENKRKWSDINPRPRKGSGDDPMPSVAIWDQFSLGMELLKP